MIVDPANNNAETPRGVVLRDLALLLLAFALIWGTTYGRWGMYDVDESRYVRIAAEWLQQDSWLRLSFNGEPYDQKPPLTFWIYAAMIKLNGGEISPWAVRLPSILAGAGIALLTYLTGLRRFGRRVGLWAGWIMLGSPLMFEEIPTARLDTFLTGFMALSLWAWLGMPAGREPGLARAALFWIGMAGAFFIKGPVGWVIGLGTVAIECWRRRSAAPWRALRGWIGLAAALALIAAWLWGQSKVQSAHFVEEQLSEQLLERVLSTELHMDWPHYYFEVMLLDVFTPWTFFLCAGLLYLWRTRRTLTETLGADWTALRPLVIWAVFPFIFLSIVPGKREQYLFPLLPAMALIVGWYIEARLRQKPVLPWVRRAMLGLSALLAMGWFAVALFQSFAPELGAEKEFEPLTVERILMAGLGLVMGGIALRWRGVRFGAQAAGLLLATTLTIATAWLGCIHPALTRPLETRELVLLLEQKLSTETIQRVGVIGRTERAQFIVGGNYHMFELEDEADWVAEHAAEIPRYILATPGDWKNLRPALTGREYREVYQMGERAKRTMLFEQSN